jgi:hypothetical protein
VAHTYAKGAINTNPNGIVANLVNSTNGVKATSVASQVNVQAHKTSVTLGMLHDYPWGANTSFTAALQDTDAAVPISGGTIHFNGTGVIGVADAPTNSTGVAVGNGTAPSTVSAGFKVQSHFAGNIIYKSSDSAVKNYSTLKHGTSATLSKSVRLYGGVEVKGSVLDNSTNLPATGANVTASIVNITSGKLVGKTSGSSDSLGNFDLVINQLAGPSDSLQIYSGGPIDSKYLHSTIITSQIVKKDNSSLTVTSVVFASKHVTVNGTVRDTTIKNVAPKALVTAWVVNGTDNSMAGPYTAIADAHGNFQLQPGHVVKTGDKVKLFSGGIADNQYALSPKIVFVNIP